MAIWIIFAVMTAAAVAAVLWPLSRRVPRAARDPDASFYRDQIAEIERDQGRGLLSEAEAEAARTEAGRRLLRTVATATPTSDAVGEPALRRRRAASALALSAVPLLALSVYGAFGSPQLPAQPLSNRRQVEPERPDMTSAVSRVEAHLAQHPEDGRGWEVIAPVYLRSGRVDDAVKAYAAAIRLLGETAPRLASYGEALVAAKEGLVSSEARVAFEKVLTLDPATPKARYYLALAAEQDGDHAQARSRYRAILAASPPDAPWVSLVEGRLASLEGGAASAPAALPAEDRQGAIRGMVEGLAARLEKSGGTADEWQRLIRSYLVLGEQGRAEASLAKAHEALAQDHAALRRLDEMAREAGLRAGGSTP